MEDDNSPLHMICILLFIYHCLVLVSFFFKRMLWERAKEGVLQNSPLKLFFPGPRINVRGGLWNTTSQRIIVKQTWPTTVILPTLRTMQHCTGTTNAVQNTSCFSVSWHLGACWFNLSALNWILTIEKCNLPSCYKVKHMHNLFCCLPFSVRFLCDKPRGLDRSLCVIHDCRREAGLV